MNYLLTKKDLHYLVLFNGLIGFNIQRKPLSEQFKIWDEIIFSNLLIKQPELKKEYALFREEFENGSAQNLFFSDLFKEKIELKNAINLVFNNSVEYKGDPDNRLKLFVDIAAKAPEFSKIIHQAVQKSDGNDYSLFEAYFKTIKADSTLPQYEVLENIKKFKTNYELNKNKKKILSYLTFVKNKELYEFIMDDMELNFTKSPLLSEYWENKLKLFPVEIGQKFNSRKIDASPFTDEEKIEYKFTLEQEWIMSTFKLGLTMSRQFREFFYSGLSECLKKKFGTSEVSYSENGIKIGCTSLDHLHEVKYFCRNLVPEVKSLFQNFNAHSVKGVEEATEIIAKFASSYILSAKLPVKEDRKAKIKI